MKGKDAVDAVIGLTFAGLLSAPAIAEAGTSLYQELAKSGKIDKKSLIQLKKQHKDFHGFEGAGVIDSLVVNLRDAGCGRFLSQNFGAPGDTLHTFLNQGESNHYGVSTDQFDEVYVHEVAGNKLVVAPEDSARILHVPGELGQTVKRLARSMDPVKSTLYGLRDREVDFKLVGTNKEGVMRSLGKILGREFEINPFATDEQLEAFARESGVHSAVENFFTYTDNENKVVVDLFKNSQNDINLNYKFKGNKPSILLSVRSGEKTLVEPIEYFGDAVAMPVGNFDFSNSEHMQSLGLEDLVVAAAGKPPKKPAEVEVDTAKAVVRYDVTAMAGNYWGGAGGASLIKNRFVAGAGAGLLFSPSGYKKDLDSRVGSETMLGSIIEDPTFGSGGSKAIYLEGRLGWYSPERDLIVTVHPSLVVEMYAGQIDPNSRLVKDGITVDTYDSKPVDGSDSRVVPGGSVHVEKGRFGAGLYGNVKGKVNAMFSFMFGGGKKDDSPPPK